MTSDDERLAAAVGRGLTKDHNEWFFEAHDGSITRGIPDFSDDEVAVRYLLPWLQEKPMFHMRTEWNFKERWNIAAYFDEPHTAAPYRGVGNSYGAALRSLALAVLDKEEQG